VAVYDDEKTNVNDLHGITGISKAEAADMEARATAGADQDKAAANDEQKSLFKDDKKPQQFKSLLKGRRRKAGVGIAATGITGGIIGLFMFTLPLKVVHMVTNIQDRFYASAEQASEDMVDNLLRHYFIQQLIPGMIDNNCTSTRVSKSCANVSTSTTIVGVLFNSWRDGRLEEKLANNHGVEIRREGNNFFLYTPNAGRTDLGNRNSADFNDKAFQELSRNELRREIRTAFESESFSKRIMYRYSVGGLLERKYGVRRCITACQTRDKITDKIDVKKNAFKSYLVERVVTPRNEIMGIAMQCAIGGFSCTETPAEADENGERRSEFEQSVQTRLSELRSSYGQEGLDELNRQAEEFRDKGMADVALEKLIGKAQADILKKTVPVIGWLDLGVSMINAAQNAGPAITKIAYVTNTTTAVAMFQLYRTSADEIKTGEVDAAIIGSVNDSFSPNPNNDQGGGGAEKSPIYDDIMGSTQLSYANSSVYAADKQVSDYTCDDGGKPNEGELCPEETVGNVNGKASAVANALSNYTNSPMFKVALGPGAAQGIQAWTTFVSPVLNAVGALGGDAVDTVLSVIPGYNNIKDKALEITEGVAKTFSTWLVPSPISNKPSGARNVNLAIVGGDISGNEFAHYGLGGKKISDDQAQQLRAARLSADQEDFQKRSWIARTFDTDSQYSFVSRTAMSLPSSTTGMQQSMASIFSNPFRIVSSLFASLFQSSAALAQNGGAYHDPAGVTQYGWDKDDPVFKGDPDKAWKDNDCDNPETKKKWGEKGTLNPTTQQIEHDVTNPCALIRSAVSSAGGKYNTDLLENPQVASSGEATEQPTGGQIASGEAKDLAKKILDSGKVTGESRYMEQIKKVAEGDDSCHVNETILGLIVTISEKYSIYISSLNRRCTGVLTESGEGSYHYRDGGGHALDIGSVDGLPSKGSTSKDLALLKYVIPLLPSGSGIGQQNCRSSRLSLPQGVTQFNDKCDHIHIQVPVD
jgi:hypothetical protein